VAVGGRGVAVGGTRVAVAAAHVLLNVTVVNPCPLTEIAYVLPGIPVP
jgi:hypothetical protein